MANPKTPETDLLAAVKAVALFAADTDNYYLHEKERSKQKSAFEAAAKHLDMNQRVVRDWVSKAAMRLNVRPEDFVHEIKLSPEDLEDLPDPREVLARHAPVNTRYIEEARRRWRRMIPVRKEPFGIAYIGDPHVENKGCDLEQLQRDVEFLRAAKVRCVNMGDVIDNFHETGKLAKIQAENRMSIKEAYSVARWLVRDCGLKWDALILGNHDKWGGPGYATAFQQWAREAGAQFYPWLVELTYDWGDGQHRVLAAHDFKGHSIYNDLHGPMRRALEDGTHDTYVAAHRHTAAKGDKEHGFRGKKYNFIRVAGYKRWDNHAHESGFAQQTEGASAIEVVNPLSESLDGRSRVFFDLEEGVEWIQTLKRRYE